jgi:uncharacterized protein (DUF849 family)
MTAPLLQACLNGARSAQEHPAVPIGADALAADAARAWTSGAHGVHVHPRDPDGAETLAPGACAEAVAAIRAAAPHIEVSLSTREGIDPDVERRVRCVHHWTTVPEVASLNFGEPGYEELGLALAHRGIGIEAGLASVADVGRLVGSRLLRHCRRVLVEVPDEDPRAAVATAAAIDEALDDALVALPRLHHGEGRATWAVVVAASRSGHSIRIGLEDTLVLPDGRPVAHNEAMVRAASELQRRAAALAAS